MQAGAAFATDVNKRFRHQSKEVHPDKHAEFCRRHKIIDDQESLRPMLQTAFKALQHAKELVECWHTMGGEEYVPLEADVQTADMTHIVLDGSEDQTRGASILPAGGSSDDDDLQSPDKAGRGECFGFARW